MSFKEKNSAEFFGQDGPEVPPPPAPPTLIHAQVEAMRAARRGGVSQETVNKGADETQSIDVSSPEIQNAIEQWRERDAAANNAAVMSEQQYDENGRVKIFTEAEVEQVRAQLRQENPVVASSTAETKLTDHSDGQGKKPWWKNIFS